VAPLSGTFTVDNGVAALADRASPDTKAAANAILFIDFI